MQENSAAKEEKLVLTSRERYSQYFILTLLVFILIVFVRMIQIFMVPIIIAGVFATLMYPLYTYLLRLFRNYSGITSFVCCIIALLFLLVPVYMVTNIVISQAIALYQTAEPRLQELAKSGDGELQGTLKEIKILHTFHLDEVKFQDIYQRALRFLGSYAGTLINATSRGTIVLLTNLVIVLFTMFYFFRDGKLIVQKFLSYIPLQKKYKRNIVIQFVSISKATVKGTLLLGLLQGAMGGITLYAFGFSAAALWGMVMVLLSIIPFLGSWLVLVPAGVSELVSGHTGPGIAIIFISIIVISNIDNLLRPRLVGKDTGLHDLLVFFSTLGGLAFFGVMGFIVGPIIASLLITLLHIYKMEFEGFTGEEQTPINLDVY